MCIVSVVYDYGKRIDWGTQNQPAIEDFLTAIEAAKKADKSLGQPDCVDPEKEKIMDKILKRLEEIESKLDKLA